MDRAWKKESAEAGDGLGQVLYQLFKKRRFANLLVVSNLQALHEFNIWEILKIDGFYHKQQSHHKIYQPSQE